MRPQSAEKLLNLVKNSYNTIASEFSDTRQYSWDEFKYFAEHLTPDANILDLGCGNGRLLSFLGHNYKYLGVDNSIELLKHARENHPNGEFLEGDLLNVPCPNQSQDFIFCIAAFHHLPSKKLRLQGLHEICRVLKPGGKAFLTVWNLWQPKYAKLFFHFGRPFNDLLVPWGKSKHPRYYHAFLPPEIKKLINQTPLRIIDTFGARKGEKVPFFKSFNYCLILEKPHAS